MHFQARGIKFPVMKQLLKFVDIKPYETREGCNVSGYVVLRRHGAGIMRQMQHVTLAVKRAEHVIEASGRFKSLA